MGEGREDEETKALVKPNVTVGATVMYSKYSGTEFEVRPGSGGGAAWEAAGGGSGAVDGGLARWGSGGRAGVQVAEGAEEVSSEAAWKQGAWPGRHGGRSSRLVVYATVDGRSPHVCVPVCSCVCFHRRTATTTLWCARATSWPSSRKQPHSREQSGRVRAIRRTGRGVVVELTRGESAVGMCGWL